MQNARKFTVYQPLFSPGNQELGNPNFGSKDVYLKRLHKIFQLILRSNGGDTGYYILTLLLFSGPTKHRRNRFIHSEKDKTL